MTEKFHCLRRNESFHPLPDEPKDEFNDWGCSYCGSVSQEQFLKFVEDGGEVEPTDKNYKAYCRGVGSGKFYFQHLDEAGIEKFIQLHNSKTMKFAYPGYFYVRPYFVKFLDSAVDTPKE